MKLIVGLGNPGKKYQHTRHNAGFIVIDTLVEAGLARETKAILAKSQVFMNSSGEEVSKLVMIHKLDPATDLLLVHDDLDLALGEYKLQLSKGPKIHQGVLSVENKLGFANFWRLRVGIDSRKPYGSNGERRISGETYVLQKFSSDELNVLKQVVEAEIVPAVTEWLSKTD